MPLPDRTPSTPVFTRREALDAGLTRGQLQWAIKSGRVLALRRGAFCTRETFETADPEARHLLHCMAAALVHDDRHTLSHLSAAVSWGLPAPLGEIGRPSMTLPGSPSSTDRQDDLVVQVAALPEPHVAPWGPWRRTSLARTIADCLRHLPTVDSVAVADAALHSRRTTIAAVESILTWQASWPYAERGRRSLTLVDGRRESPLESRSFVRLHLGGIALPWSQAEIYDGAGRFVARVDGLWAERATACEADGRVKYAVSDWPDLALAPSAELVDARLEAARRAIIREKVREDRLRDLGLEMVRFGTVDIEHRLPQVIAAVRAAWKRGDPARFSGRISHPLAELGPLAVHGM